MLTGFVLALAVSSAPPVSAASSTSAVLLERRQECASTTSPALSPQALVEELNRASLQRRQLAEAQQLLKNEAAALAVARIAIDTDRAALDADKKAFAQQVARAPKPAPV